MSVVATYIVPHPPLAIAEIGRGEEAKISDTLHAYREVAKRIAEQKPDTIVFISPHSAYYGNWIYVANGSRADGNMIRFDAPEVSFELEYDDAFRDALIDLIDERSLPAGYVGEDVQALDHGIMVPLYFIEKELPTTSFKAVSIGGSALPKGVLLQFGRAIGKAAEIAGEKTIIIASGDLSHKLLETGPYGYHPAGPQFDEAFCDVIKSGDPQDFMKIEDRIAEDAAECGLSGFVMMAGAIQETKVPGEVTFSCDLLSYEGPLGVGYGVAAFEQRLFDDNLKEVRKQAEILV